MRINGSYKRIAGGIALALALGACGTLGMRNNNGNGDSLVEARVDIKGFLPNTVQGEILFKDAGQEGLHIDGKVRGLLPGQSYAMHIHEFGSCDNPEAPGAHFDPGQSTMHGGPGGSPGSVHAGDLPNITANDDGVASVDFTTNALGGGTSAFSVVGRSVVIHSNQDDYATQPSGNSGVPIACGVVQRDQQQEEQPAS